MEKAYNYAFSNTS